MSSAKIPLWEIKHPYYCAKSNDETYASWEEFIAESVSMLPCYNPLFRWYWLLEDEDGDTVSPPDNDTDPCGTVSLFYVSQRRGGLWSVTVTVRKCDEPAVREYLQARWKDLQGLWTGIS